MPNDIYSSIYTPEYSANFLAGQLSSLDEGLSAEEARASKEGDAGGIIGKFGAGAQIGAARYQRDIAKSSIIGQFNKNAADAAYNERMTKEGQAFSSSEAQKDRDFRESIARMGYQFSDTQRQLQQHQQDIIGPGYFKGAAAGAATQFGGQLAGSLGESAGSGIASEVGSGLSALWAAI